MASLAFKGAGTQFQRGNADGPPETYTLLPEFKTITFSGAKADLDDVTNLDSTGGFHEYITTLLDGGEVQAEGNYLANQSSVQESVLTDFNNFTKRDYKVVLPNSLGTLSFAGYVVEPPYPKVEYNKATTHTIKVKITGPVTFA